jgi:hypothetical protein
MNQAGATPSHFARVMARDTTFIENVRVALPKFAEQLREFWDAVGVAGLYHVQDSRQLKASFGGDLFPGHWENPVSTAGLYIDTIILPCPIMRIAPLVGVHPDHIIAEIFVKHTLTAMTYRNVATANADPPIALVLPDVEDFQASEKQELLRRAEPIMLKHAGYLFDRSFESLDHFRDFSLHLITIDQVLAELKGMDRLLFDNEFGKGPRAQLESALAGKHPEVHGFDHTHAGSSVHVLCWQNATSSGHTRKGN